MPARHIARPIIPTSHRGLGGRTAVLIKKSSASIWRASPRKPIVSGAPAADRKRISIPRDHTVRKIAWVATRARRSSARIYHFDRAVRTYCEFVMKYRDNTVITEYVYLRLKRHIADEKRHGRSVYRRDLPAMAETVFSQIEANILHMVDRGRRIKTTIPRGRYAVMSTIGESNGRKCFLICEDGGEGVRYVKALQTAAEFNRRHKRRFHESYQKYHNDHPVRRRGVILH